MADGVTTFRALVTGVSGQDGWYLAQRLVDDGHEVHGIVRSTPDVRRVEAQLPGVRVRLADLKDDGSLRRVVEEIQPDRIYNLAGSTSVARSWVEPVEAADVIGIGAVRLLSAAWDLQQSAGKEVRLLQASSAEIFGDPQEAPQNESTAHGAVTPYGAAKAFAHAMVHVYRRRGMFAAAAILYNHESPRRPSTFVARKITRAVAAIARGSDDRLVLGNMDVRRDWGYAPDHVDGMLRILAADTAEDYIVATGEARSVRDFVEAAFATVGIVDWERYVSIDPTLYRPTDPQTLVGDASRLRSLGWRPTVGFTELVETMVRFDLDEWDRSNAHQSRPVSR